VYSKAVMADDRAIPYPSTAGSVRTEVNPIISFKL
jgi:hypothetical protein